MQTLEEAKRFIKDGLDAGCSCPCCGQYIKRYRRCLNSGMAQALIWIVRQHRKKVGSGEGGWVAVNLDAPPQVLRNREWGRLEDWGMIQEKENADPAKKESGLWMPTEYGVEFACNRARAWRRMHYVDGKVVGNDLEQITIVDALGEGFNYQELMQGA